MDRPLWQILLTLFVVAFTLSRAAAAYFFFSFDAPDAADQAVLGPAYVLQALAGAATAAGLWAGRPWARVPLLLLGVAVAGSALLEAHLGVRPVLAAVSQVLVAALSTGALFFVLTRELVE